MLTMRIFGLIAYATIGAAIGAVTWYSHVLSLDPIPLIMAGAVIGLGVGINSWVQAERRG